MTTPKTSSPKVPRPKSARSKLPSTLLMLALTALLLTLLFPPFYLWFLAPFALVPFTVCIIRRPLNLPSLFLYYLLGLAFFVPNLFWLGPVTVGGYLALAAYVALYFPLYAFGTHRLIVQLRMPAILAVPLVWTAVEFVRSSFVLGGFPWFILGNSLAPATPLIQIADLAGVWGVSFFLALLNGSLVDLLRLPIMRVARGQSRFNPQLAKILATASLLTLAVLAYGLFRLNQNTTTPGPTLAVLQENIPQSNKDNPNNARDIFLKHYRLTLAALDDPAKPDLIVWPETMVPGYGNPEYLNADDAALASLDGDPEFWLYLREQSRAYMQSLANLADTRQTHLLLGIGTLVPNKSYNDSIKQNRVVLMSPGRGVTDSYDKVHLVPFGEFIPFRNIPWVKSAMVKLTPYKYDYSNTPGTRWTRFFFESPPQFPPAASAPLQTQPAKIKTYTFGTPICFEDTMPYPSRNMVMPRPANQNARLAEKTDFLVNVSNEGWFYSVELDQHLQATQLRAVENRVPIARSVNTGNSGFVDSNGRITKLVTNASNSSIHAVGYAVHQLQLDSRLTIYTQIGDIFPILCGMAATLTIGWTLVRPRRGVARDPGPDNSEP